MMARRRGVTTTDDSDISWNERRAIIARGAAATDRALAQAETQARRVQQSSSTFNRCLHDLDRFHRGIHEATEHAATVSEHLARSTAEPLAVAPEVTSVGPPPSEEIAGWTHSSVRLDGGVCFEVMVNPDIEDPVSAELSHGNSSNQSLVNLMLELVQPGDRILDIGAHVGTFSLAAAAAGARPLALDASPENVALLRASASLNSFGSLLAVHAAASDAPGTVDFLARGPWGQVLEGFPGTVKVPAVTLAELVEELAWHPVVFVKIDVEGSEMKTLKGMGSLLDGPDAPAVLFESNAYTLVQYGLEPGDLIGYLESHGYVSYLVDRPRLIVTRPDDIQPHTIVDYLAVKRFPMGLAASGWEVLAGMSPEDWVARVVSESAHPDAANRRFALGAMGRARPEVIAHPSIGAALEALADDPDEGVRAAARQPSAPGADDANDAKEDSS